MKEAKQNIWDLYDSGEVVCITTNGFVKKNGEAVMGRGTARQAVKRWPSLPRLLGNYINEFGNTVYVLPFPAMFFPKNSPPRLVAFPVKAVTGIYDSHNVVFGMRRQFQKGSVVPGWAMKADLAIIAKSLEELKILRVAHGWDRVYLPRPGCGAGELNWETQVKPLCEQDGDWLIVVHI